MDQVIQQGQNLNGFGQNNKGTAAIDIGPRYKAFQLVLIATAQAGKTLGIADFVGQIGVNQGNKPQRSHTGLQLDQIQGKYGVDYTAQIYNYDGGAINYVPNAAGTGFVPQAPQAAKATICYLTVWFSEVWRSTWTARDQFSWVTQWYNPTTKKIVGSLGQFSLEVTGSNNAVNVDYTQPYSCTIFTEADGKPGGVDAQGNPVNLIMKWYQIPVNYAAAGLQPQIPLNKTGYISELIFFCQAGDFVSQIYLKVNGAIKRNLITKTSNDVYLLGRGFNSAYLWRDRFDLVLDATDKPQDMLNMVPNGTPVSDFTLQPTLAAAAAGTKTFTILAGYYASPD